MANEVSVEITVEERQALRALTKLTRNVDKLGDEASSAGKQVDGLSRKLSSAGAVAVGAFGAGLALKGLASLQAVMGDVVDEAIAFDKAIREVNTLLPKSEKLTGNLVNEIKNLGSEFATTDAEQAKSFYQIVSAGAAEGADAVELLRRANELSLGGLSDVGSSINVLTDILNVYGQENISAAEASDALFQTVKLGKTTISQLSSSIGQVIPSAARLNVGLDEVGAALATMTTQGLTTSERVTQLNSLFSALFKKSGDAGKLFGEKVGNAFSLTALRTKGLNTFLQDLITATGGSEETLQKLLGRTEAVRAVFALTGDQTQRFTSNLDQFTKKAGAATDAANEMKASLEFRRDKVVKDIKEIGDSIFDFMLPHLESTVRGLRQVGRELTKTFDDDKPESVNTLRIKVAELNKELNSMAEVNGRPVFARRAKQIESEVEQLNKKIEALKQINTVRADEFRKFSGGAGLGEKVEPVKEEKPKEAAGLSPAQQAEIDNARRVNAEITMINQERDLAEEERQLRIKEAQGLANEEDFIKLNDIEAQKISIRANAELEKTALIKNSRERELAEQKLAAKTELDLEKLQTKQIIAEKKRRKAQEDAIQQAKLSTARNFLGAGIALAKEGSAAQKGLMIADATISTYAAATKALAAPPGPPWSVALASSIVALGLANVAKIAGVGFQNGGVVGGFNGSSVGPDNTIAQVRTGEMILNSSQQRNLFDQINSGELRGENSSVERLSNSIEMIASQPIVVQVDNKEIASAVRDAGRDGFRVSA
jgi:TP901 family phage tail tape measure protein